MLSVVRYFFGTVLLLTALIIGGIYLFLGGSPSCGKNSVAAEYARSITQARLEKMFLDMEELHKDPSVHYDGYSTFEGGLPSQFADLKIIKVRPKEANIMVQGCFDHHVYLNFYGIRRDEPKSIELQYGEHEIGIEKLWPK